MGYRSYAVLTVFIGIAVAFTKQQDSKPESDPSNDIPQLQELSNAISQSQESSQAISKSQKSSNAICCGTVMVENFDGQTYRQGLFSPMSDGTSYNGVPVYEQDGGDQQMWYKGVAYGWAIGHDFTSGSYGIQSSDGNYCPEDVSTWEYWDGNADVVDQDATVRCSDCTLYPANDECCVRCGTVMVENFDEQSQKQGLFSPMSDGTTYNGVPVYEQIGGDQQMWFRWQRNGWLIGPDYTAGSYGIQSSDGNYCPEDVSTWEYWDGNAHIVDQDATVRCSNCTLYPYLFDECCMRCGTVMVENFDDHTEKQGLFSPMSDGTAYNGFPVYEQIGGDQQMWFKNNGWVIGPNYTTSFYGIQSSDRKYCPEFVSTWEYWEGNAAVVDQDATVRCSDCNIYPANDECHPAPVPTPLPAPIMKNMVTYLKNLIVKKKVKTALVCQAYCGSVNGATHFKWKYNKKVVKRDCTCQQVGYKNKKNYSSGSTMSMLVVIPVG